MLNIQFMLISILLIDINPLISIPTVHAHSLRSILIIEIAFLGKTKCFQLMLSFDWHFYLLLQLHWLITNLIHLEFEHMAFCEWYGCIIAQYKYIFICCHSKETTTMTDNKQLIPKQIKQPNTIITSHNNPSIPNRNTLYPINLIIPFNQPIITSSPSPLIFHLKKHMITTRIHKTPCI